MDPAVQRELFEDLLVAAVRKRASFVYVYPTSHQETDVVFRLADRLIRWYVEARIAPSDFVAVIKDCFKQTSRFSDESGPEGYIQRWIDEQRVGFRVTSLLMTNQDNERQADAIRIEVLRAVS